MPPSWTCLPPLPVQTSTAEELMGSPSPRERGRAAGVCVCQRGLGEEAKPWQSEVTSGLSGNCVSCQCCRHSHPSSGQARDTPSDGLALQVPLQGERVTFKGRRRLMQAGCLQSTKHTYLSLKPRSAAYKALSRLLFQLTCTFVKY